jgi:hypothetical protein
MTRKPKARKKDASDECIIPPPIPPSALPGLVLLAMTMRCVKYLNMWSGNHVPMVKPWFMLRKSQKNTSWAASMNAGWLLEDAGKRRQVARRVEQGAREFPNRLLAFRHRIQVTHPDPLPFRLSRIPDYRSNSKDARSAFDQ